MLARTSEMGPELLWSDLSSELLAPGNEHFATDVFFPSPIGVIKARQNLCRSRTSAFSCVYRCGLDGYTCSYVWSFLDNGMTFGVRVVTDAGTSENQFVFS